MSEKNGKDDDEYSKITKIETSISELDKTLDIKYTKLDESKDDKKVKMIKIVNILTKLHDIRRQINNIIGKRKDEIIEERVAELRKVTNK